MPSPNLAFIIGARSVIHLILASILEKPRDNQRKVRAQRHYSGTIWLCIWALRRRLWHLGTSKLLTLFSIISMYPAMSALICSPSDVCTLYSISWSPKSRLKLFGEAAHLLTWVRGHVYENKITSWQHRFTLWIYCYLVHGWKFNRWAFLRVLIYTLCFHNMSLCKWNGKCIPFMTSLWWS